jgi:signal transduction histidine kinase
LTAAHADHGVSERLGLSLPSEQRRRLVQVWMQARIVAALLLVVINTGLALLWSWPNGFIVAGIALPSAVDAFLRFRARQWRDPLFSILLDSTMIFLGMSLAAVPESALGIPFAYTILASLVLLRVSSALGSLIYAALWFIATARGLTPTTAGFSEARIISVGVLTDLVFTLGFVGLITVMIQVMNRDTLRRIRQARMREAIARASNVLLSDHGERPLETALDALREATSARSVFVFKNIESEELGLCTSHLTAVVRDGVVPDPESLWDGVPWNAISGQELLERGLSHTQRFSELTPSERALYEHGPVRSELNIPIFVEGSWWGILGFSDEDENRTWARRDEQLLFTAAEMIGAYIERAEAQRELDQTISDLDLQVRYQHALAECAAVLHASDDARAIDGALRALLGGSDADYAYIDENYHDAQLGLCARITADADRPGAGPTEGAIEWWAGPYSELPTSFSALGAGKSAQIKLSQLEGREREIYEEEGIQSELCLPIFVGQEWRGSVAFADFARERDWSHTEVRALHAAAQMIGTWWERAEAKGNLEQLVASQEARLRYEKAIADCSRALVMSADETAVDVALRHLVSATGAHRIHVDRNREEPELGLVAQSSHELIRPGYEHIVDSGFLPEGEVVQHRHGRLVYSTIPTLRQSLERGRPLVVQPRKLSASERQVYSDPVCLSELNIPIMARDRWLGTISFSDYLHDRTWDPQEIVLLQTVAEMIGAFWERNDARERLEELIRSKDEFVASVSHELRTPLTSVVGLAAELRDRRSEFAASEVDGLISIIADQSTDVADIVNDLLVAARADIGTLVIDLQPVGLRSALTGLIPDGLHARFEHFEIEGEDVQAMADGTRLRQILRNLIVNAARYGGDNVRATVSQRGRQAVVTVADDGRGIGEDRAEAVFEAYARAHREPSQPASVGLGLAVARQLARLMGGDLVYERRDEWTEFVLTLPLAVGHCSSDELGVAAGSGVWGS